MSEDLAERAAWLWLNWKPQECGPCPADVADAITEWAETIRAKVEPAREKEEV